MSIGARAFGAVQCRALLLVRKAMSSQALIEENPAWKKICNLAYCNMSDLLQNE